MQVYNFTGTLTGKPTPPDGGDPGNPVLVAPVNSGLPAPWKYAACYVYVRSYLVCLTQNPRLRQSHRDNAFGRIFATQLPDNQTLTVESCVAACNAQGNTLAGMEFGVQCCEHLSAVTLR